MDIRVSDKGQAGEIIGVLDGAAEGGATVEGNQSVTELTLVMDGLNG